MSEVLANGVRLHVQRLPGRAGALPGPPVVCLHGLVLDNLSSYYYTLAGPVTRSGSEVILYDQRGHGRSERTPDGYDADTAVADLAALLEALDVREPVRLVGNSYGGVVALHAALTRPDLVAGLVLVEAQCIGDWADDMAGTLGMAAIGLEADDVAGQLRRSGAWRSARKVARLAASADALLNRTTLIEDVTLAPPLTPADLAAVQCPVLAVYGEHSGLLADGRELLRQVPDCTLEVIPGLAHTVLREATGPLCDALLRWLGRQAVAA